MNKAFQTRQEKAGQAHMVLSVGNRGAAPHMGDFLDAPQLSKHKDKTGKKKDAVISAAADGDGVTKGTSTPDPGTAPGGAVISAPPTAGSPLPGGMMKSGFFRIAPSSGFTSTPGVASPAERGSGTGTKLTIGLKRKGGDELHGPSSKKR